MSTRERLYVRVRKTYEMGHYEYSQTLFHLLEDGMDENALLLLWDKWVTDHPEIMTQMTSGQSVYATRG